jgi:hypothetical protein
METGFALSEIGGTWHLRNYNSPAGPYSRFDLAIAPSGSDSSKTGP